MNCVVVVVVMIFFFILSEKKKLKKKKKSRKIFSMRANAAHDTCGIFFSPHVAAHKKVENILFAERAEDALDETVTQARQL